MRVLVTGASGFVGSMLLPRLLGKIPSGNISVLVLPQEPIPPVWKKKQINIIKGDITSHSDVTLACRGHSHVIHLAAIISYWKRDREKMWAVNVQGVRNILDACNRNRTEKLIHISSVGAVGFNREKEPADETTPFNWSSAFAYMHSKYQGQLLVEQAVREKKIRAVILNPASIMGPGDPNVDSPHNRLYQSIYRGRLFGSFSGGLAIVDVRDLADIISKALFSTAAGEKYLIASANLSYRDIIRTIGRYARKKVYPVPIPPVLLMAGGFMLELFASLSGKKPLLTTAYGKLSGWHTYYSNEKSKKEFHHRYIDFEKTIKDSCAYFEKTFLN
jgi:dihydroflavonol-4-reductase